MKVHVVGSGGREHALRVVLGRTAQIVDTIDEAEFVVVGPETPLVDGLADKLRAQGKLVYGPGADGARLEGSKAYMKEFVSNAGVPTARHQTFTEAEDATAFMKTLAPPYVVKTDGLAAGKGVFVGENFEEACDDVRDKLSGKSFGDSGTRVVIEEGLSGPELSLLYVFDGKGGVPLPFAQDHKRMGNGDTGGMTGGVGAYSPVPIVTADIADEAMRKIIEPTIAQLRKEGIDYRGTLYAGLMLTADGLKLIEYNVRFGDPESQVVLPRFGGDLTATLASAARGALEVHGAVATDEAAITITMCSAGYPSSSTKGSVITGVEDAEKVDGVIVFQAGTAKNAAGQLVTNGGRVLNVTALAPTLAEARRRAYEAVNKIQFDGMQYRTDIAEKAAQQ